MTRQRPPKPFAPLVILFAPLAAAAQPVFEDCLDQLRTEAVARGISAATADQVLPTVRQLPRVVQADRDQPEFVETFATYLGRRVTANRVATGRQMLERHRALLDRKAAEYGVPAQIIVALWGLETDYGRVIGDVPVFDSLATLACDGRRGEYFTTEFVNALRIVERGIGLDTMIGSWAGAMGQTQFMPSNYLSYAVDGDGDGVVDLWRSVDDAFSSAANLLRTFGWEPGWRWGREVLLPEDFDYALAGRDRSRPLSEWRSLGVRTTAGDPIPSLDADGAVLVPSGHEGPAFLIYRNFSAIMRWNPSEFFALTVGHLADRIAGGGELAVPAPDDPRLTRPQIAAVQRTLNELGFASGEPDGIVGTATRRAVRDWQQQNDLVADGHVDAELLRQLSISTAQ